MEFAEKKKRDLQVITFKRNVTDGKPFHLSVRSVEQELKEKKKNAQPAEAQTQKNDSSVVAPEDVHTEQTEASDVPVMPFDLSKVDPAKIELAEKMGIPIKQLIAWAASVEVRFAAIQRDIASAPDAVVKALKAEAAKGQQAMAQRMQQTAGQPHSGRVTCSRTETSSICLRHHDGT